MAAEEAPISVRRIVERSALLDAIQSALGRKAPTVLAHIDLDNLRAVNVAHGHQGGSSVLSTVIQRVLASLPARAMVSPWAGDEIVALLRDTDKSEAIVAFQHALAAVAQPIELEGCSITQTISVGLCVLGAGGEWAMRAAESALFVAKILGRNRVAVLDDILGSYFELSSLVRTDALTGLRNPRALYELEAQSLGVAPCEWSQGSVLFVDVDHFGPFNKSNGDHAGDDALRSVGRTLARFAPPEFVYRKGGEEFVLFLPHCTLQAAVQVGEELRLAVEGLTIARSTPADGSDILTVTVGVAAGTSGTQIKDVRVAAGLLTTQAKQAGARNRVHS